MIEPLDIWKQVGVERHPENYNNIDLAFIAVETKINEIISYLNQKDKD